MKKNLVAGVALSAVALSGAISISPARADLTYQGAVGLPLNPTAQIPELSGVRVQANYFDLGRESFNLGGGNLNTRERYYSIVAAGRVADRIELNGGIARRDASGSFGGASGSGDRTGVNIGAKYLITRESDPQRVRLAVGVGYDHAQGNNIYGYGVATKSFGRGISEGRPSITGHLGLRYDRFRATESFVTVRSNKLSVYGGIEVPISKAFTAVGELQSKNTENGVSPYSLSVRYRQQTGGLGASVGIQRTGLSLSNSGRLFAQVGYTFGGGRSAEDDTTPAE